MMFNSHRSKARLALAAIGAVAAFTLAGCAPAANTPEPTGDGVPDSAIADAQALVDQYSTVGDFTAPGEELDASRLRGKKVLVVVFSQAAAQLVTLADGIKAAADVVGLETSFINADANQSAASAAIQQGISQKVDAIILDGVPAVLFTKDIEAAGVAGIPVVAATIGTTYETPGLFGLSSADYNLVGQLMAAGAILEADGEPVTAGTITFTNPAVPDALAGIDEVFRKCGDSCSIVATSNVEPPQWATGLAGAASSMAQANPDVNTIFAVVDDTMGMLAASGITEEMGVNVVSGQGSGAGPLGVVQQGGPYVIDVGQSAGLTGWGAVDQALRAMLGLKPGANVTPPLYLDTAALEGLDVANQDAIYGNSYVDGFTKLWGLSG